MWCWWCCHPFNTEPLRFPHKYDDRTNKFCTSGNFCSWSCMKAYNMERPNNGKTTMNIMIMRRKMYNSFGNIHIAPSRFRLQVFGGPMTIEEFRANQTVDTCEKTPIKEEPYKSMVIKMNTGSEDKMAQITHSTGKNEPLKLKRAKPLKRDVNNLEMTLGITRKKN